MKLKNLNEENINEIRKRYDKKNGFFIRIRKDSINPNIEKNIVYYKGIKAFYMNIQKEKKEIEINMADNIFKLNKTNIKNNYDTIANEICEVRKRIKDYFSIKMTKIRLKKSKSTNDEYIKNLKDNLSYNKIPKSLQKYFNKTNLNSIEFNSKGICYIDINKIIEDERIEDYVKIEELFIKTCIFENGKNKRKMHIPEFTYKPIQPLNVMNFENDMFDISIKNTIDQYIKNTKEETEKSYQHQFMIDERIKNKCDAFKNIYRFEEECYIKEGKKENSDEGNGRIDSIFLEFKNKEITDIYLIELKVDDKVLDGTNGIKKHLEDIEKLYTNENKKIKFLNNIKDRVKYRKNVLEIHNNIYEYSKELNIHYWIIIGYTSNQEKVNVLQKLNKIENEYQTLVNEILNKKEDSITYDVKTYLDPINLNGNEIEMSDIAFELYCSNE